MPTSLLDISDTFSGVKPAVPKLTPPRPAPRQDLRAFGDAPATRKLIFDNVLSAAQGLQPLENTRHRLELKGVAYAGVSQYSVADRKRALLEGRTLSRRLRGSWVLSDKATGEELDRREMTVANVPYLTNGGTFVHNGNEYTLSNQLRLRAGSFTRIKDNGEIESHANIMPGKGRSHRYFLDPEKGVFYVRVGQAKIPLASLLRILGASDDQMRDAWGNDLFATNSRLFSDADTEKFYDRFVTRKPAEADKNARMQLLREAMEKMEIDPDVALKTLGKAHKTMSLDAILDTTRKLLAVSRGEANVDDRDHLAFQTLHGPEDLFAERIAKDYGNTRRTMFNRASWAGNLSKFQPGMLTKQLESALLHSGLGQSLEEINPADVLDKQFRVSRLGEGGIPSLDAIPDEARAVQPSHFGFLDPIRTPESFKVGVDVFISSASKKGRDGRLYSPFTNARTGKTVWKSPQDVADLAIAFPGEMSRESRRIFAMQGGRIRAVLKEDIDLILPHFENAFSPLGNMVPLKSMVKGQRVAMASRMLTQALPLVNPEAPWVQAGMPGGEKSYEDEYGRHMGALRTPRPGRVVSVDADGIVVRYRDGTLQKHDLYNNFPYNRKTYIHQTPTVRPGDTVRSGDLLAISNYTNKKGVTALGKNARVAYLPFRGLNFEDAIVISQSFANKLSSEHMYQHKVEFDREHKRTRADFLALFPSKYNREQFGTIEDNGAVRVGTRVEFGDPIILDAGPRAPGKHKVHRKKSRMFADESVVWNHHSPGVVTDVVEGRKGTTVLVKSIMPMQQGDKLCFDPATSLMTRRGWKPVAEITDDDEIATLNPATGCLEWQKPDQLYEYDHTGKMYRLKTKHLDMLVTPNHGLWVARPGEAYQKVSASDFFASKGEWQFKKDCDWQGREERVFHPLDYTRYTSRDNALGDVPMDLWLQFVGYYISEGRCQRTTSGGYQVQISQFASSPAWQDIADCLTEIGIRWAFSDDANRFEINSKHLYEIVAEYGDSAYTKCLPDWIHELASRQLRILFDAYMDGDGHRGACWEYGTSSEQLSFDLELVLLKIGWCGSPRLVERSDNFQKNPHWRTRVNRHHLRPWWKKSKAAQYESVVEEMTDYNGKVYCVTVPNHIVYVKRGEKSYWSLNSGRYG